MRVSRVHASRRSATAVVATSMVATACGPSEMLANDAISTTGGSSFESSSGVDGAASAADVSGNGDDGIIECPPTGPGEDPIGPEPLACEAYADRYEGLREVTIAIVNDSDEALVIFPRMHGPGASRYFDVAGSAGGRPLTLPSTSCAPEWEPVACRTWFEDVACPLGGVVHSGLRVDPGARFETTWNAGLVAHVTLPAACTGTSEDQPCSLAIDAVQGEYVADAFATPLERCMLEHCELDESGTCLGRWPELACDPTMETHATWNGMCDRIDLVFTSGTTMKRRRL